ncbi:MAG: SDR family NAD(P)-dependent oxidoreductase [Acetivibrionales bacterium]|jgi:NAD(P)-dependent dehydrogenase (short-subunit alcohol dehydrogenase family)
MMKGLKGKIAIVTGGARGLGKKIAERLLREDVTVVLADIEKELLGNTVNEFCSKGYKADSIVVDLRKTEDTERMVNYTVKKYGRLDILVNNAGIQIRKWLVDFTEEDWDAMLGVNLKAVYFACQSAARIMIPQGSGSIICISSEYSERYTSKRSLYCISKGGINSLVGTLGVELARFGLRVNAVAPGFIDTDMLQTGIRDGLVNLPELISVLPNKRLLFPKEIASVVCFLASEESSGITGQTLFVDGGMCKGCLPEPKELK